MAEFHMPGYCGHRPYCWSRADPTYKGPHDPPIKRTFEPHVLGYTGYKPKNHTIAAIKKTLELTEDSVKAKKHISPFHEACEETYRRSLHSHPGYGGHRPEGWRPETKRDHIFTGIYRPF
mmetsp:Transcript_56018/g.133464  ORF Transcript_56018/g.133464 Transcript_56018/m.133464 type:complete len:120 (-) Transcript_56018:177-536(-)